MKVNCLVGYSNALFTTMFCFIEKLHIIVFPIVYIYIHIHIYIFFLNIKSACKNNIVTFDFFNILSHASETVKL